MNFTKEQLENLRIHELRDLARSVGVKSPTSKTKEVIIDEILQIASGKSTPHVNKTRQGRPVKHSNYTENLVDALYLKNFNVELGGNIQEYNVNYDARFEFVANANEVSYNANFKEQSTIVNGLLDIHKNGYGIVRINGFTPSSDDVFLHNTIVTNYNLKTGYLIEGEAKSINDGKIRVMQKIISINGVKAEYFKNHINFEDLDYDLIENKIKFNELENEFVKLVDNNIQLLEGSRTLVFKECSIKYNCLVEFSKSLSSEYNVYVINLDAKPEEKGLSYNNVQIIPILFNQQESVQLSTCNLVIEKAKRDVESGKKVVVIINKMNALVRAVNNEDKQTLTKEISINTAYKLKNLIMCAKNSSVGNLTLIVFDTLLEEEHIKNFILYDMGKAFNNILSIRESDGTLIHKIIQ